MLSIGTVSAGNTAQREYHERQLAQSRDDYYRESEGPAGVWVGTRAEALGLSGEVDVEQFRRMLDGQNPATGEDLGGRMDRRKTVAFDLAFSAPKSVSLLRMAADEATSKTIDRAHERAVLAAVSYIEQEGWKGRARVTREDGSRERVTVEGTGVVGVLYRHETTRNADPQLHSHVVVANVVQPEKGDAQAINSPILYRQAKTAGSVYQAVLRGELGRELGLTFDTPVNGLADIKGFARPLIERWSTRRTEILQTLAGRGLSPGSKLAAERAALESRRAKDMGLDHAAWRGEVRDTLAREGFGIDQVHELVRTPAERELVVAGGGPDEGPRPRSVAERLADAPMSQVINARATDDARAFTQAAMSVPEGYTFDEVEEARRGVLEDERVVQISDGEVPRYTSVEHLELEERVVQDTLGRMGEATAPRVDVEGYEVPTKTPDGYDLSGEQRQVLDQVLTSGHGVEVIRARAGAGKTTIAGLAKTEFEAHGLKVVGVAPTLQALAELDDVGLTQRETIARTATGDGEHSKIMRTMDHQTVVLVDEAGMAQTRQIAPLLDRAAECGAKVVVIGDDVQLASVGAGGWFRYLAEHENTPILRLTEVHRQRDPVERDRLNGLHRGDVNGWIRWADHNDRIHVQPTVQDAYTDAVGRYGRALDELDGQIDQLVVMAPENAHRRALNEQLRRVVVDRGIVDRSHERDYGGLLVASGERLVAMETVTVDGTSTRIVENGERFEVLTTGPAGVRALAVAGKRRGEIVKLPAAVLEPGKDSRVVDHAYARTVHKAQGMTVDRSILFSPEPARLGLNLAYVGVTRTRDRADLVTVAPDRAIALERLTRGMAERHDHQAAVAVLDPTVLDTDRLTAMTDPQIDEHRHTLLTEARGAMTQLTRLDREFRGAYTASGDARTDAQLLARRNQLVARIDGHEQLLADHDPTGDRADRGLMEHTTRQALARDRAELQRFDERLEGRDLVDVDKADEVQARIRKARIPVQDYLDSLLERLDVVHGQQIDRSTTTVDPLSVPEHERPALALRQEAQRRERVGELTMSAGQQLGTGHPQIARWLDRHTPAPDRTPTPTPQPDHRTARPTSAVLTPAQEAYADALERCDRARGPWSTPQGRRQLQLLALTVEEHDQARESRAATLERLAQHEQDEPARVRRGAHERWETTADTLRGRVDVLEERVQDLDDQIQRAEQRHGAPLRQVVADAETARGRYDQAATVAVEAERTLLRMGPAGFGTERTAKLLGRRDHLTRADQRRYDELAGRMAVDHVQSTRGDRGPGKSTVGRDIALWRHDQGLPLTERQTRTLERHIAERGRDQRDPSRDVGPDLGR
jgi:conjugative relaxase-like TrwC/TraI family protein